MQFAAKICILEPLFCSKFQLDLNSKTHILRVLPKGGLMRKLVEVILKMASLYFLLSNIPHMAMNLGYAIDVNSGMQHFTTGFYLSFALTIMVFVILFFWSRLISIIIVKEEFDFELKLENLSSFYIAGALVLIGLSVPHIVELFNRKEVIYEQQVVYFVGYTIVIGISLFMIKHGKSLKRASS